MRDPLEEPNEDQLLDWEIESIARSYRRGDTDLVRSALADLLSAANGETSLRNAAFTAILRRTLFDDEWGSRAAALGCMMVRGEPPVEVPLSDAGADEIVIH